MLDACAVITALMKRPENNFQFTVGRWKFNFRLNQHLANNGIKQTINSRRIVLIGYWRVKKKVTARDFFFLTALNVFYSSNVFERYFDYTVLNITVLGFFEDQRPCLDVSLSGMPLLTAADALPDLRLCKPKFSEFVVISDM